MTTTEDALICRNVWKVFGAHASEHLAASGQDVARLASLGLVPAVRAVDLAVRRGEIFVIMGLSGSGKSTLVRCLSRLSSRQQARFCSTARTCLPHPRPR